MTTEETIDHLNQLIETARNGELGYLTAARDVGNTELESVFTDYAKQRAEFVRQLQAEVVRLGGTPTDSGTIAAALHRGWIDVKSAILGGAGGALVAACETGEDHAAVEYERVVNMDISGQSKSLVEKQWRQIKEAHTHMLRLKEKSDGAEFQNTK